MTGRLVVLLSFLMVVFGASVKTYADTHSPRSAQEQIYGQTSSQDAPSPALSQLPRVFLREIRITGNTVISDAELSVVAAPYVNREVTFEELQSLRQELTTYYINRGYVTSGVIIPDQQVIDGVITLHVIEGKLKDIRVEGNQRFRSGYISDRLSLSAGPPVNIYQLQESLLRLQQDQRIRRINAELSPGIQQGESSLKVSVEENLPFKMIVMFSNHQSPSMGAYRGDMLMSYQNLLGIGDSLEANLGLTEGVFDYWASYAVPITARDTILKLYARKSASTVIETPFEDLDIQSLADTIGISISHPLFRTARQEFSLSLAGELRRERDYLLDREYSFSGDTENGKTNVTVVRFSQEWVDRSQAQVIAARSCFSLGLDAFGATVDKGIADGQFLTWLGQVQWVRQLTDNGLQVKFRTDLQLATDTLLPLEKFSVGGMNSVRGFRENQLVRDNGLAASLEIRVPVFYNQKREVVFQLIPFTDFGWSWNKKISTPSPKTISSIGLGFVWAITDRLHLQVYGGIPLRDIESSDNDLQDEGIHFQLTGFLI